MKHESVNLKGQRKGKGKNLSKGEVKKLKTFRV